MAKKQAEVNEYFVKINERTNGRPDVRFEFVIANDPRDAIAKVDAKDHGKRIIEIHVYDSADDYHRGAGCLTFDQHGDRF